MIVSCAQPGAKAPRVPSLVPEKAFQATIDQGTAGNSATPGAAALAVTTVAVVGLNDFHGHLLPQQRKTADNRVVESGGASVLASMIHILREEMQGRVLVIDAGDEWQGTMESNQVKGATVTDFFGKLGVNVAAIGNHEFDFTLENLQERAKEAKYTFLAANIYEKKNGRRVVWENVYPSKVLDVGGIYLGVIGTSTQQTPGTTRYEYVKHLNFVNPAAPVREQAKKLREIGANAVLLTSHAGTICKEGSGAEGKLKGWSLRSASTPQGACDAEEEIYQLAKDVGPKVLDGIIAGHTHQIIHHWLNGIPVVQDEAYDQFFNIIYYSFDSKTHQLLPELTRIEGLVPICEKFFKGAQHCDLRRLKENDSTELEQASFHGHAIVPDPAIEEWLKPIKLSTEVYRKQIIATSGLPLAHHRDREDALGNLVADVIKERSKSDFALVNSGGIRTSLDAGPLNYDGIFRALPFDNYLNVIKLKGKDVKLLFEIATAGNHGLVGVAGLKLTVLNLNKPGKKRDLNKDGKQENWEENRLLDIKLADGSPLKPNQWYTVGTFDFLVNGGDDLHWFMDRIPRKNISHNTHEVCRDLVRDYLAKKKVFNTIEEPLVDLRHPRIVIVSE